MTALLESQTQLSPSPGVLSAIRAEDCNLAIWERPGECAMASLLDAAPEDVRFTAALGELETRLSQELTTAGYPAHPARAALAQDILTLAERYAGIMELDAVSVRLAVVTTNSCRKFHADYVKARLITTYVGTGTQWIDTGDVERLARGEEPRRVHTMGAGDVGLFKGKIWTDNPAIHRSPPIEGTDERRLILVLDPATA